MAVELHGEGAAPGEARDVRAAQREGLDQGGEAVCVVRQAEVRGDVRGAARARLVPGDYRELIGQGGELGSPHPAIHGATVYEDQRRSLADLFVGDLESVGEDDRHWRKPKVAPRAIPASASQRPAYRSTV